MPPRVLNEQKQLERENEILNSALSLIERNGIAMLTMDKLVCEVPYSKGTVYNHFSGKEDLILGLCNRSMSILAELFGRVATFDGILREKALAIQFAYMLYARLYPAQFMLVITAKSTSVTDKSCPWRYEEHIQLEGKLMSSAIDILQRAIESGDMDPPIGNTLEQISFAWWSLGFGTNALLMQSGDLCAAGTELVVEREMFNSMNIFMDGLKFRPLTEERDWSPALKKLKQETFKEEVKQLSARGITLVI